MRLSRAAPVALLLLALVPAAVWVQRGWQAAEQRARGAALFRGEVPVQASLVGHGVALPAVATRCSNCHEAGVAVAAPGAASSAYAATLTATRLTAPSVRRGGPPSAFDAKALCTLLRSGVDPAHVMIASTMPRYPFTESQCQDLWAYLMTR